jgi:hypothetical protein
LSSFAWALAQNGGQQLVSLDSGVLSSGIVSLSKANESS